MGNGFNLFGQRLQAKLAEKYTADGDGVGIDWQQVLDFLIKVIPLVAGCFMMARPKSRQVAILKRRMGNHARLVVAARQAGVESSECRAWADASYEVVDEAKDAEVLAFIDDCCSR